jgi:hypothetical protein
MNETYPSFVAQLKKVQVSISKRLALPKINGTVTKEALCSKELRNIRLLLSESCSRLFITLSLLLPPAENLGEIRILSYPLPGPTGH